MYQEVWCTWKNKANFPRRYCLWKRDLKILWPRFFFIACERRRISGLQPKHNDDRKYVCVRRSSSPPPWSMGKHAVDWWALKAWHDNLQSQNRRQNYLRYFAQKSLSDVLLNSNGQSNFFSEITQFEGNVSTLLILSAIVANLVVLMHCNF